MQKGARDGPGGMEVANMPGAQEARWERSLSEGGEEPRPDRSRYATREAWIVKVTKFSKVFLKEWVRAFTNSPLTEN